ncbi:MAG TPA: Fic family protein [Candidatus Absconditabacterales bacterium]|nr:Fic family protein [Candidatus Absconditabacterales bacterium]
MNNQIKIPDPLWGSDLANVILDLEKLRSKQLSGTVPPYIFFQLKEIFHIMETLGSARIEGNNTTLAEYVEKIIEKKLSEEEKNQEIQNIEKAMSFIEDNTLERTAIDRAYISQLHMIITENLSVEGSKNPGDLRKVNVTITGSKHTPPDFKVVQDYFDEFVKFTNSSHREQYQLLMVAIAHHRFAYIHPFDNGNGRMGRVITYAFLIKMGFQVKKGRIINSSAIFYSNRQKYYDMLAKADSLKDNDILSWCEYFLLGLKNEIEKIDSLLQGTYVRSNILIPTIDFALEREHITDKEHKILSYLINSKDMTIKAEELNKFGINNSVQKSRTIAQLRKKGIVSSITPKGRIYTINFVNNYLLRGIMHTLEKLGFISDFLNSKGKQ